MWKEKFKIRYIIMKWAVCILRILYIPMKAFPVKRKVTFISRQSDRSSLDIQLLSGFLKEQCSGLPVKILTRKLGDCIAQNLLYGGYLFVQMYHIATSKVVIIDGYCIPVSILRHKKATQVVQMWHALGAIKKFGHQTIDKPSGHSHEVAEIMCMHKNYDYVICTGEATAPFFCKGFHVEMDKICFLGLPRLDRLLQDDYETEARINAAYPYLQRKKNILYAPTFRKGKPVEVQELVETIDQDKYNLIVKLHPLDEIMNMKNLNRYNSILWDKKFESSSWLKYCDYIITDYSAMGIEAAVLNKPVFFYLYDLSEYEKDPGINISFKEEAIGQNVFSNSEDLLKALEQPYDFSGLRTFREKYVLPPKGRSYTEALGRFVFRLLDESTSLR